MITPLKRGSLRRRLAAHVYDAILKGELRPGERIVEGKLARQLSVAQGTLREALQELEHQGLVTKHDHRGTYVSKLTRAEIEDIYVVRRELEPLAASLARQRMTAEQLSQLVGLVEKMQIAGDRHDFVELLRTDLAFHRMIWRFSGSKSIERALNVVCPPLFGCYLIKASSGNPYNRAKDLEEHRALLNALKEGTPEEVKKVFTEVIEVFRASELQNLQDMEQATTPVSESEGIPAGSGKRLYQNAEKLT